MLLKLPLAANLFKPVPLVLLVREISSRQGYRNAALQISLASRGRSKRSASRVLTRLLGGVAYLWGRSRSRGGPLQRARSRRPPI